MASPLPPDPYIALGVPKDATPAAIKTAHRKLVLKCHPDKVSDPLAKEAAADLFHKIQTAYEILVDQDRRERYDASVRLAELRKEKLERHAAGGGTRGADRPSPSPYMSSQESVPRPTYAYWESERATPQTEERRPSYAKDYFDLPPRASTRKDHDYERTTRRPAHDSPKQKVRAFAREAKDTERERRREKTRKAERDTQRDRDRKYGGVVSEESESTSDEYERRSRRMREEDEAAAVRRAREAYYEQASKQQREAEKGYFDERTRKMFAASADAWDYIRSSRGRERPESERRRSPIRQGSAKDKFEYIKGKDGRPAVVSRRTSERPKTTGRDADSSRQQMTRESERERERERRSSAELVEELRRPPTLGQSKSSPADILIPPDKPRAQSVQVESGASEIPKVKRSETMPYDNQNRAENVAPSKFATSRGTEFNDGLATPGITPEYTGQSTANSTKYRYGRQYADDVEYPTPDGYRTNPNDPYRTEVREPTGSSRPSFTRRITRSPSPVKDSRDARDPRDSREAREKLRSASARYPSSPQVPPATARTRSYVYSQGQGVETRPNGGLREPLYGEIGPTSESPRPKHIVPEEAVRYQRPVRPEDIRVQSGYGYSKRGSTDRPSSSRNGSGNPVYTTSVRAA